jgi:hypothetical protein
MNIDENYRARFLREFEFWGLVFGILGIADIEKSSLAFTIIIESLKNDC